MNLYPATAFIRHLLGARSAAGHGVHSPFVFNFLTKVVRGESNAHIISEVESLRSEMLADRRTVRVTDLGAGSAVHKGEERRISEIATSAALPQRHVALLSRIAGSIRQGSQDHSRPTSEEAGQGPSSHKPGPGGPGIILELGTSLGISTLALALAAPERRVVTVEGCPSLAEIARENLRRHSTANAEVLNMEFSDALNLLRREGTSVSMAFIDGNHRGEALKQYVSDISTMGDEMIIVADDIHLNRDMYNSWRSLVNHEFPVPASRKAPSRSEKMPLAYSGTAPATMETFRFGILFCLRSLTPRHYRIRY